VIFIHWHFNFYKSIWFYFKICSTIELLGHTIKNRARSTSSQQWRARFFIWWYSIPASSAASHSRLRPPCPTDCAFFLWLRRRNRSACKKIEESSAVICFFHSLSNSCRNSGSPSLKIISKNSVSSLSQKILTLSLNFDP